MLTSEHSDDPVLVVGHERSAPASLKALGHPEDITIAPDEYSNRFVVVPTGTGPPVVLRLRF